MPWIFQRSKRDKEDEQLFFGVELEFAIADNAAWDGLQNSLPTTVECGGDISIEADSDEYAVELRFHPATWLSWCENVYVRNLLRELRLLNARTGTDANCGMHVHFSNVLTNEHTLNVMQFIYAHYPECLALSGREPQQMQYYAYFPAWKSEPNAKQIANEQDFGPSYHYSAINVTDQGTVEVRLFAGTLDGAQFYANLGFVKSLIEFTNPFAREFNHTTDCDMCLFRDWLYKNRRLSVAKLVHKGIVERINA